MFNEILGEVEHWDRLHLNGPSIVLVFNPFDFCKMNSSVSYQWHLSMVNLNGIMCAQMNYSEPLHPTSGSS